MLGAWVLGDFEDPDRYADARARRTTPAAHAVGVLFTDQLTRRRGRHPPQALRALSDRWVGIHHGCLRHRSTYDEATAWNHLTENFAAAA